MEAQSEERSENVSLVNTHHHTGCVRPPLLLHDHLLLLESLVAKEAFDSGDVLLENSSAVICSVMISRSLSLVSCSLSLWITLDIATYSVQSLTGRCCMCCRCCTCPLENKCCLQQFPVSFCLPLSQCLLFQLLSTSIYPTMTSGRTTTAMTLSK